MDRTSIRVLTLGALVVILWWSLVNFEKFGEAKAWYKAFFEDLHSVRWLSKALMHLAFYGAFISGLVGVEKGTFLPHCAAIWWLFFALYLSHTLVVRTEVLESKAKATPALALGAENVQ